MSNHYKEYQSPLVTRYASSEMSHIFSSDFKFNTWRKLWIALAKGQQLAGLNITNEQIQAMIDCPPIDFRLAEEKEKELRHDVMAHVHTFAKQCPKAAPIIHLGATSAFVDDNTDLIQMKRALEIIFQKLLAVVKDLSNFASKYKSLPTIGYTHFQPGQLTTVGKRTTLWIQDLLFDIDLLIFESNRLPFRGIKGTLGTQASFLQLLQGDVNKIDMIDNYIASQFSFDKIISVSGQTYTRKIDDYLLHILSSIAQSASKFACDIRLLSNKREIKEPIGSKQIGSSAMAYKQNPMRSERIGSIARFVMALKETTAYTASTQWFERTLDDSANKRLSIPEAFLGIDAILHLYRDIANGMTVQEEMIKSHVENHLPFIVTEEIIMEGVKKGGNRQSLHETIRQLSFEAIKHIDQNKKNPLIALMSESPNIPLNNTEIKNLLLPERHIGRSIEMTDNFLLKEVSPKLNQYYKSNLSQVELKV